jgi:act minimal PKS acyl carrier protein
MRQLTIDDLSGLLRECAGEAEDAPIDGDIGNTPFTSMGYDSLAVLETAGRLEREYGIRLSDDSVTGAGTPNALISLVNEALSAVG